MFFVCHINLPMFSCFDLSKTSIMSSLDSGSVCSMCSLYFLNRIFLTAFFTLVLIVLILILFALFLIKRPYCQCGCIKANNSFCNTALNTDFRSFVSIPMPLLTLSLACLMRWIHDTYCQLKHLSILCIPFVWFLRCLSR